MRFHTVALLDVLSVIYKINLSRRGEGLGENGFTTVIPFQENPSCKSSDSRTLQRPSEATARISASQICSLCVTLISNAIWKLLQLESATGKLSDQPRMASRATGSGRLAFPVKTRNNSPSVGAGKIVLVGSKRDKAHSTRMPRCLPYAFSVGKDIGVQRDAHMS